MAQTANEISRMIYGVLMPQDHGLMDEGGEGGNSKTGDERSR